MIVHNQPTISDAIPKGADKTRSVEETASQFEEVLARQFVQVMTKNLFEQNLAGEDGPGWMSGQADIQRDVLTDVLTKHLVEQGGLGLSEMLVRQWQTRNQEQDPPVEGSK